MLGIVYFNLNSYLDDFKVRNSSENIKLNTLEIRAATAAPLIPKRGNGPMPKINKGSKIILEIKVIKKTYMDKSGLPSARSKLLDISVNKPKGAL